MNLAEMTAIGESVADTIKAWGAKNLAPVIAENAALRERVKALEAAIAVMPVPKDGRDGKDGADGTPGADGKDGSPGVDGKDATVDVAAIVETVIKSIPAPKDGKDAPAIDLDALARKAASLIPTPPAGKDGASVEPTIVKAMVLEAVDAVVKSLPPPRDGRDGKDGKNGLRGDPGIPGKDAAEIVPLNGIDEARSYPLGTYAAHNGGMFRAYRATDPVIDGDMQAAGWQVCWQGIKDIRQALASDARTQITTVELSDGKCVVSKVKHPAMLFRGTWSQGVTYERGDAVSWGGNAWHAKKATSERPGDEAQDWEIAARRGRDGKDLGRTT